MADLNQKSRTALEQIPITAELPMERRHVSILAADMAGYSRWMASDEDGVIRCLRRARAEIIDPTIIENGGRIVRVMGDGLLVEFSSPVAALTTAISIQQALVNLDIAETDNHSIQFRIGLNMGDVVVDGDDLLGDCVNIAARLESIAPVGGICLSRAVHDQVCDRIDIPMTPLGAQALKNMPKPVEVWQINLCGTSWHPSSDLDLAKRICRKSSKSYHSAPLSEMRHIVSD